MAEQMKTEQELNTLIEKVNKNILHLVTINKQADPAKYAIYSKDCDGCEHHVETVHLHETLVAAIDNLRKLEEELRRVSIVSEARKDVMLDYFKKFRDVKIIATKYPDLPVSEVLEQVVKAHTGSSVEVTTRATARAKAYKELYGK